jgi:hypothetical protein
MYKLWSHCCNLAGWTHKHPIRIVDTVDSNKVMDRLVIFIQNTYPTWTAMHNKSNILENYTITKTPLKHELLEDEDDPDSE